MTIRNTFPSDNLVPGTSSEFDFTSGSRSLVPTTRRVLLVGAYKTLGGGAVADVPIQVFGEADASLYFGASYLSVMCRAALAVAVSQGVGAPELWAVGTAEPGGGTAATGTLTAVGTTTASGDIVFSIAGVIFRASVASGANATTCAAAMVSAVNAGLAKIPGTVANAAGVLTYTHAHKGVDGNDVKLRVTSSPAGVVVTPVNPVNGAGALTYTTALANSLTRDYDSIAIESHTSTETAALLVHMADAWGATKKRWRHAYVGETGSVSTCTTLAAAANDYRIVVVAYPDAPGLPGVYAAGEAIMVETRERPNYNHNKTKLPALPPVLEADELLDTEIQSLLAGGCSPLTLDDDRTGVTMVQTLVTTQTTIGGNPFRDLLFLGDSKSTAFANRQCDFRTAMIMKGRNVDAVLIRDVKSGIYSVLKELETAEILHNVDAHAAEIKAEADPANVKRIITEIPTAPVPIANQVHTVQRMFVEAPAA